MIDPEHGYHIATVALILFAVLGAFDGVYFHMVKYRLYMHPPARLEHQIHTIRGILFLPITLIFFVFNSAGAVLWLGLSLLAVDFIAEIVDVLVEKNARKELGGISPLESVIHVTATGFRMSALAIVLALKPLEAYAWNALSSDFAVFPSYLFLTGLIFTFGVGTALLFQGGLVLYRLEVGTSVRPWLGCCQCSEMV